MIPGRGRGRPEEGGAVRIVRHNEFTTGDGASGEVTLEELISELQKLRREVKRGVLPAWNRKVIIIES